MIVDLEKCVGCGACAISCKLGNSTPTNEQKVGSIARKQSYKWSGFITDTIGTHPNTTWRALPVQCNHCTTPRCVGACPVRKDANGRKAVYKRSDGIVVHNNKRCIGCGRCQKRCLYSVPNMAARISGKLPQNSVISMDNVAVYKFWNSRTAYISGCTASPRDVRVAAGVTTSNMSPYITKWTYADGTAEVGSYNIPLRKARKCTFCIHRLGDIALPVAERQPNCVLACPAGVRTLTENSAAPGGAKVLKAGTDKGVRTNLTSGELVDSATGGPNVYYVNDFSKR